MTQLLDNYSPPFHQLFYSQAFQASSLQELSDNSPIAPIYFYNTVDKCIRIAKEVFSYILFPIAIFNFMHSLLGKLIFLPSSTALFVPSFSFEALKQTRVNLQSSQIKRIAIETDGNVIDALIIKNPDNGNKRKWLILSNGNAETYEDTACSGKAWDMSCYFNSHVILFNYPGVGASTGMPSKHNMTKAYKAILNFVEDKELGLGASEIVGYGFSIGGGVQAEALKDHLLKPDIKYVFIKDRSFSSLADVASGLLGKFAGILVEIFGWNINAKKSSETLEAPEIIIQRSSSFNTFGNQLNQNNPNSVFASRSFYKIGQEDVLDDGVIPVEGSLAHCLLNQPSITNEKKVFLGVKTNHCGTIDLRELARCSNILLN